jgi:uncharacterized cupin superfamily protein
MATASTASSSPFGAADDIGRGGFVATSADRTDWRPAPIRPEWILDGTPVARFVPIARGRDDLASTTLWDCTEGTFRWHFVWDETVHILDGAVVVTLPDATVQRLSAGSIAFFPAGSSAVWKVEGHVRKLAVCRRAFPAPLARAVDVVRRAKRTAAFLRSDPRAALAPAFADLRPRLEIGRAHV